MELNDLITITISSNRKERKDFQNIFENFKSLYCRKIIIHGAKDPIIGIPDDWEYHHEPKLNHYQRHLKSILMVKTPFVLEAAEDDKYSLDFIQKAIDFLLGNDDYVSCRGLVIGYNVRGVDMNCYLTKSQLSVFPKQIIEDFYSEDPIKRVNYFLHPSNLLNPSRNVKRVDHWKSFLEFLCSHPEYWPLSYIDRIEMVYESLAGNIKTLEMMQILKKQGNRTEVERDLLKNDLGFEHLKKHSETLISSFSADFNADKIKLKDSIDRITKKSPQLPKDTHVEVNKLNMSILDEISCMLSNYGNLKKIK